MPEDDTPTTAQKFSELHWLAKIFVVLLSVLMLVLVAACAAAAAKWAWFVMFVWSP